MVRGSTKRSKNSRNDSSAAQDVILRHYGKIRNIGQEIGDSDEEKSNWGRAFDCANRIADLGENVVRIIVTYERPEIPLGSASENRGDERALVPDHIVKAHDKRSCAVPTTFP